MARTRRAGGFTLIELMVTVGIVAILAAIAYPSYSDYITRGQLVEGVNALASVRAQMEQYYQDNRTYKSATGVEWPCTTLPAPAGGRFTLACTTAATTYTVTATGKGVLAGFVYTIDQQDNRTSTFPARWGGTVCASAWLMKRGATCS